MSKSVSREVKQLSGAIVDSLNGSVDRSGLVYVEEHESFPGFTRKRSGANFVHLDLKGTAIRDDEIITRVGDIRHCFADISRSRRILGFKPCSANQSSISSMSSAERRQWSWIWQSAALLANRVFWTPTAPPSD
jgi:hypothetical protein